MIYPPTGRLLADSYRGPIVFTYVLFWVNKTLYFSIYERKFAIKSLKMFYLMGRVERVDGPEKCSLNLFELCGHLEVVYIYILVYEMKIVTNIPIDFKI